MRNEVIELVTQYKSGTTIAEKTVEVMAKRKSLGRTEFYAAYGVGLTVSHIFVINPAEYYLADQGGQHATHVRYNNKLCKIIRTYEKNRFEMELTVQ